MRILAIEDNTTKAKEIESIVFEIDPGATFKQSGDIGSAYRELDATVYDLVVLDLMMPLVDGWTTARRRQGTRTNRFFITS